jgi:polysaccharide biosynthesis/export protein
VSPSKHYIAAILLVFSIVYAQQSNQIKQAQDLIKAQGLTKAQVEILGKQKGLSQSQINTLNKSNIQSGNKTISNDNLDQTIKVELPKEGVSNNSKELIFEDENLDLVPDEKVNAESKGEKFNNNLSYFGYDIFKNDPAIFQGSSLGAVNSDYLIGAGDEIIVMLWGETQFRLVIKVDREGFLFIPEVGQVFVNGLTLNLLESKLFKVMSQSYSSLKSPNGKATTFLDVSLGKLRSLRIQILGEVSQPGAYIVDPSTTLFSALYYFKGPTKLGSLRDIHLIRNGTKISSIDFYDYLLTGKKPNDVKLQIDDVIFIPRRLKTISINGEVNRPGVYELKPSEQLSDLLELSGGLSITAYLNRAQIDRIVPFDKRREFGMDRKSVDINLNLINTDNFKYGLQDGDKINIFSILDATPNTVSISGAVVRPGRYDLGEGLNLTQLIDKADGLLGDVYLDRVDIIRITPDLKEEIIKLDLGKVINSGSDYNFELKGLDKIQVYGFLEMRSKQFVSISGNVKYPGRYALKENMTVYDLIFKAGGYVDRKFLETTYLERAELIGKNSDGKMKKVIPFNLGLVLDKKDIAEMLLKPDDMLKIYSLDEIEGSTRYVNIFGHVKTPGNYELYESNMTVYDLLFKAGGFEDPMFKMQAYLDRADLFRMDSGNLNQNIISFNLGEVLKHKGDKNNFKLLPGDEIKIYPKSIFDGEKSVFIQGSIEKEGRYKLKNEMTIKDLILESGGVLGNVFSYKIEIARVIDSLETEEYVEIINIEMFNDFSLKMENDNKVESKSDNIKNFKLMPFDNIYIRPNSKYVKQEKIEITGEVQFPGYYSILGPYETVKDIIQRSGGLRTTAYPFGSTFQRGDNIININIEEILKKKNSKKDIFVRGGDKIVVNKKTGIIKVLGEVNSPGLFKYVDGYRIRDLLSIAGGLNGEEDPKNIFIKELNGKSKKYSYFLGNHRVRDGSILIVGKKAESEPFDKTEYAKELTSIIANLAQAISILLLYKG